MSWLRIDDKFEDNAKVALISDAAHRLWFRVACWSCRQENLHTGGFVPEKLLPAIAPGVSKRKLGTLSKELVEANAAGTKVHGLWEPKAGGFQIHDWDQYRPPPEKLSPSEAARIAGKKSAEVRRRKNGTAQPNKPNVKQAFGGRSAGPFVEPETKRPSSNEDRTSRTPEPEPEPEPEDPKAAGSDPRPPGQSEPPSPPVQRRPRNREQALEIPVIERAQLLLDNPELVNWTEPHHWPEVQRLGSAIAEATGWRVPRWTRPDAKVVTRMIELLAEFSLEELGVFVRAIPDDPLFKDPERSLDFTSLTDGIVRRALDRAGKSSTAEEAEEQRRKAREAREAADAAEDESARQELRNSHANSGTKTVNELVQGVG